MMDRFDEMPQFPSDLVIEEDPVRKKYESRDKGGRGGWEIYDVADLLTQHLSSRYGPLINQRWNIGIIGFGEVGQRTLEHLETLAERGKGSDVGDFYIATSKKKENEGDRGNIALDSSVTTHSNRQPMCLGIDWKNLDSDESQKTLQTIVDETDICIVSGDVGDEEFERICREEGIDPEDKEKRRDMKTKANIGWVNKIAEKFRDYKGIVLMITNLSDDLAYAFGNHMQDPYQVVGMSYVDTARLHAIKRKIRDIIVGGVPGITDEFKELKTGGDDVLENITVYSVGTHDNPYPLIYYRHRLITELTEKEMQPIRDELKSWGFEMLRRDRKTDNQTGKAAAETVIQMMRGAVPMPVSLLFDYKSSTANEKQGYFTVPVMFKLEAVERKGKPRLRPRPRVIKPQLEFLLEREGFRELVHQHAAKLRARKIIGKDGNEEPMFPVIEDVHKCSAEGALDFGDLYAVADDSKSLNRYFLTNEKGTELNPQKMPLVGLEGISSCKDSRLCCILEMKTRPRTVTRSVAVVEDDRVVRRLGPFPEEILHASLAGDDLYVAFMAEKGTRIVRFEPKSYSAVDLDEKVKSGVYVKGEVYAMGVSEDNGGLLVYSARGRVFCSDLKLQNQRVFAETGTEIERLKILPKARLVIGTDDEKLHVWSINNPEEDYTSFNVNGSYFDAFAGNGEITVLYASDNGISLETFKSKEELFSRKEGAAAHPAVRVKTDNLMGLHLLGDYIAAGLIEEGENHLKVFGRDFTQVEDFVINEAEFLGGYEVAER